MGNGLDSTLWKGILLISCFHCNAKEEQWRDQFGCVGMFLIGRRWRLVGYEPFCLEEPVREHTSLPFEYAHNRVGNCKSTTERKYSMRAMDDNGYHDD